MNNKLGSTACFLLYLGVVRLVDRNAVPFIASMLALALVFYFLVGWLWKQERP